MDIDTRDVRYFTDSIGIDISTDYEKKLLISVNMDEIKNELFNNAYMNGNQIVMTDYDGKLKTEDKFTFTQEIVREVVSDLGDELKMMQGDENLQHAWEEVMVAVRAYLVTRKMVSD